MNPLRGLAFDADAIARYTTSIEGPVLLVGHSYGGAVISQAAPTVKTSRAWSSYRRSRSTQAKVARASRSRSRPHSWPRPRRPVRTTRPGAAGGPDLFIKIDEFHRTFCADLPADLAATMAVSQRPLSLAALTEKATVAEWKDLPSWYLVSAQDNAIPPDAERFMAKRAEAVAESVDGSHAAFIAHPDVAAGLIIKVVAAA